MTYTRPHLRRRAHVARSLRRAPQQQIFVRQGEDLAQKAVADLTWAGLTRIGASAACCAQEPNYILCRTLDDVANQQAAQARDSLLRLTVWGGIALLAAIFDS